MHLQYQRCLLTPVLADIESYGMQLDEAAVDAEIGDLENGYAKATSELQELMEGASPTSTPQKNNFIYNVLGFAVPKDHKGRPMTTPAGDPSVGAEVLARLRPTNKRQEVFLAQYKAWAAIHSDLTKYLRKFKECCSDAGGALHATFNQCATRTHRLSSSGLVHKIQFQNLNRDFKHVFKARNEGWLIGEADGAQLEFRIATHLGRDAVALSDILQRVDIHSFTASIIGCSRQDAKPHTFKPLYGGTSGTDSERAYYAAFAEKYWGIANTQRGWTNRVVADKKLVTEYGLIFYWPDCALQRSGYITHTTSIYNYPVQGFATAEIIPIALICAWHRMKDMKSFLVNTVHDSIIGEIHPEEINEWHNLAQQCLIRDCYNIIKRLYNINLTVPLGAGVLVDSHWGSKLAKESEVVYEADPKYFMEAAKQEGMV
jgi:DNA polymerase I-like protein with 3'-5' exonuclease and polymerase domains